MPVPLQVHEHHDRDEAADVQAAPRRIEADVRRDGAGRQRSGTPSVCWYTSPRHRSSSSTPPFVCMAQK